jgi:CBS domain-containing protein
MTREGRGYMPMVHNDSPAGVVTDRDLVIRFCADSSSDAGLLATPVREVMTTEVVTIDADANLEHAAHVMAVHHARRLRGFHGAQPAGIRRLGNLGQAVHSHGDSDRDAILDVMAGP